VGEFPLIERLTALLPQPSPDVWVGIGDDVAAIALDGERLLLLTCDVQVEGTHFLRGGDPMRLGRKAAAINLSDIAAAGGVPKHFLISLVLPADTELEFVERLYEGFGAEARRFGADVVGGNTSRGATLAIDVTLVGESTRARLLRRDGARPGDRVIVTGRLGAAAAGLHLILNTGAVLPEPLRREALDALEIPTPRVAESRLLVESGGVTAAIDVSDGLAADLGHVCDRSAVGVRLDAGAIPIHGAAEHLARAEGRTALDWVLGSGEDYELLFMAPAGRAEELVREVEERTRTSATIIGEIVADPRSRTIVSAAGASRTLGEAGWRHF
jgi:thiamine-monophosphate kinase